MTTDDIMAKVHMAFDQVSLKFEEENKLIWGSKSIFFPGNHDWDQIFSLPLILA